MFSRLYSRYFSTRINPLRIQTILKEKPLDQLVTVNGWVKAIRRMKKATFIDLDDGSCITKLQVLLDKDADVSGLSFHCSVSVSGTLRASRHPKQEVELHADHLQVVGRMTGDVEYPFAARQRYSPDYVRQFLHSRPRTNAFASTLRLRAQVRTSLCDHLTRAGFLHVDAPLTTTNECEGGGDTFSLKTATDNNKDSFFGRNVFLSVSGQMHLEALANGLAAVYTFNPAFRADGSLGRRHLAEFWMLEAEEAFMAGEQGLECLQERIEALVQGTLRYVVETCQDDLAALWAQYPDTRDLVHSAISTPFARVHHHAALLRLEEARGAPCGPNLSREDELLLTQIFKGPVFVTHWPADIKPFYMARSKKEPNSALCLDLLLPGVGEVVGGSVREHDPAALQQRLPLSQNLEWYLQLRHWGAAPSAGFGLGFERLLLFLSGVPHIKDVIPFPRSAKHCDH